MFCVLYSNEWVVDPTVGDLRSEYQPEYTRYRGVDVRGDLERAVGAGIEGV